MPMMKDSGLNWIGVIPFDWSVNRMKYLFAFGKGLSITKENLIEEGLPVISYGQVHSKANNGVDVKDELKRFVSFSYQTAFPASEVKNGDFVFADTSEDYEGAGNCVYKRDNSLLFGGYHVVIAHSKNCADNRYFAYLFQTNEWRKQIRERVSGVKVFSITQKTISNASVVVPPIKEQQAIANYLDAKCAEIDALSADIQAQIDTLEEYKRSVITESVTKGLNKDAEMQDSGIEWASQIPKHWAVMPNKYVMKKIKHLCPRYAGEDILSLTMNGVIVRDLDAGGKMPTSFDGYQWVYPDNLLMCLFDYDVTPRCIGLVKNKGLTSPAYSQFIMKNGNSAEYYYYYYLMIDYTKELLHLAKNLRHSFTEEQLGAINTPVPPVNEQIEIAHYLDEMITEVDAIISSKKEQLTVLDEYKKSTIYEYVTGKKEVPNE